MLIEIFILCMFFGIILAITGIILEIKHRRNLSKLGIDYKIKNSYQIIATAGEDLDCGSLITIVNGKA